MARWNATGRPSSPKAQEFGYNIDTDKIELYTGTEWRVIDTTTLP